MRFAARKSSNFLLTACFVLAGCSSSSDSPNGSVGGDLNNDPEQSISESNFEGVLVGSLKLLRADYFETIVAALATPAALWPANEDAVVGSQSYACADAGSVQREVTEAPEGLPAEVHIFKLNSRLDFNQCEFQGIVLHGLVTLDWQRSSPAQIASTSRSWSYGFEQFIYTDATQEIRVTGQQERRITAAGPGDAYDLSSTTDSLLMIQGTAVGSLTDAQYRQQYEYQIALPGQDSIYRFTEAGQAEVTLVNQGFAGLNLLIDPALSYGAAEANGMIDSTFVSGQLRIVASDGSSVTATANTGGGPAALYQIKDKQQQETSFSSYWPSAAVCRDQPLFAYNLCRSAPVLIANSPR